jgi:ketosteroid isomerase-like protein
MKAIQRQGPDSLKPAESQIAQIKAEVKQAAIEHLNAKDAPTALSHYTEDAMAVSNDTLYPSFEKISGHVKAYYNILKEVNLAVWDDIHINVINNDAALFTGKFCYSFTSTNNERTDLQGVWTGLYVRDNGSWKIRVRHESVIALDS